MPLYMDFHKFDHITVEDVINAHIADQAVQDRFGVKYHQFWLNEDAGTVFCLTEGPDKKTCEAVHQLAHGNIACALVEVETGFYKMFMGETHKVDHGIVHNEDGSFDSGLRTILVIAIRGLTKANSSEELSELVIPHTAKNLVKDAILKFRGRKIERLSDDSLLAVFHAPESAIHCARHIQAEISRNQQLRRGPEWNISYKIGVHAGQPLTEQGGLFEEAIRFARRMSNMIGSNQLVISSRVSELVDVNEPLEGYAGKFLVLTPREEAFITQFFDLMDARLSDGTYSIENLSRDIGMSRPQLYRKMTSLTGRSPNDFIRDFRMDKALSLIIKRSSNISEIALEVGYNSPSYFSKCFQRRFGCNPSDIAKVRSVA